MNLYKKFIPKKARFAILRAMKAVPDETMIRAQYWIKLKRRLNLECPTRYTEKINWYKLYYRDPLMPICVDKYRVREYLEKKGLSSLLVQLYKVYENPDQIRLADLPDTFVMKTTNGSGTNVFCRNKAELNEEELRRQIRGYFRQSSSSAGREWPYEHVTPRIVAEELLEDPDSPDGAIRDYKFLCFSGKPAFVVLDTDRFTGHKRNIFDIEWNDLHVASDCPCADRIFDKPDSLQEMLSVAEKLSEDFPAVRVDLYSIRGRIYFGELTFFPWSGYVQYDPDAFDFELGEKFVLPEANFRREKLRPREENK